MALVTPFRVFKFGGSSVGAPERIARVTDLVAQELGRGGPIAIVVSAMGDTTDWLIDAAKAAAAGNAEGASAVADRIIDLAVNNTRGAVERLQGQLGALEEIPDLTAHVHATLGPLRQILTGVSLLRECTAQTLDLIMSFGERTSASVLADLLTARGIEAVYVDARDWVVTNDRFGEGVVDFDASRERLKGLKKTWGDRLPVHTGFLGRTPDGRTTTLGRNGSDYTATLLARGLDAAEVSVWTDVSGVMTADPNIVADAYPLHRLSYMTAVELAYFGTKMFHPKTMIPLIESGIPMRIRNTMRPDDKGTRIDALGNTDPDQPISVTSLERMALLEVEWRKLNQRAQVGEKVLSALDAAHIPVWMASQSAHGQAVAIVIPAHFLDKAKAAIADKLTLELERREVDPVRAFSPVTLLSLVCGAMGQFPNVAGRFFQALGGVGVNIRAIAQGANSRSISCVIDSQDTVSAVRTVHSAFNFAHQEVSLFLVGKGVVGAQLLAQVKEQAKVLRDEHGIALRVVGLCSSKASVWEPRGVDLTDWSAKLDAGAAHPAGAPPFAELLDRLGKLPVPILVDCTGSNGMEAVYRLAFERGVHVVAANKKPLTIAAPALAALLKASRDQHRIWRYETTVGASLPVIDTLKNLVRTGDHVRLVEGSLSGTLGYLTNEVMAGTPLSYAVRIAKEKGYTEPDPRDDLNGMDVARKALILARELGLSVELSDVQVEPFVPAALFDAPTVEAFLRGLEGIDAEFAARIARLSDQGKTLRYLCRIQPGGDRPTLTVGPVEVPRDHPAAPLRGSEAFVAFTTARYADYPLIVRGAGAGGAVTAAGVLADVLAVAQTLRGR